MNKIVLVDDHSMLRSGLAALINTYDNFNVLFEADNGKEFIDMLDVDNLPDLVLMDITMPLMDGYATTKWIKDNHPKIKVLALSMMDDEYAIIRMLKNGARGYIVKNTKTKELLEALKEVIEKGFYFNDQVANKIATSIHKNVNNKGDIKDTPNITQKEKEFLILTATEKTYKEIAEDMFISPRTVDSYRDTLFEKLNIKTRVGLAIYAIKNNLVKP